MADRRLIDILEDHMVRMRDGSLWAQMIPQLLLQTDRVKLQELRRKAYLEAGLPEPDPFDYAIKQQS